MYSDPTGFEASELHARTLEMGIEVWDLTIKRRCILAAKNLQRNWQTLPYSKTAASDAVLYSAGTTLGRGIFAITSFPFSVVIYIALLKPPSILSILDMSEEIDGKDETSVHRASTLNLA